jgi:hypothetical protein
MNLQDYNAMLEGDTKLTVRLAITMGWNPKLMDIDHETLWVGHYHYIDEDNSIEYATFPFKPFTDISIPFGLIGHGVQIVAQAKNSKPMASAGFNQPWVHSESKTYSIINAYCAIDPLGYWSNFVGTST